MKPSKLPEAEIRHAAELLRAGKLVAFPTETVYGLGANALDADAVERIFEAKGRPHNSPIIVHVSSRQMARQVVAEWPSRAELLAAKFWPGPLTLVLTKQPAVPDLVTAGLPTVGVRMPAHPLALALIEAAGVPIAAPSANRFAHLSPTTAEHVRESLGDQVAFILDGGPCTVGIESTVLSLTGGKPLLLRPGGVSRDAIELLLGPVEVISDRVEEGAHLAPGMHPRHYSPETRLVLAPDGQVPATGRGAYLRYNRTPSRPVVEIAQMPSDAVAYATRLYDTLHRLDHSGYDWIAVEAPPADVAWEAIHDRLGRAAARE